MPRGLNNWTAGAVIRFLKTRGFAQSHARGSHFYYKSKQGGRDRLVCVPVHGKNGLIAIGTMKGIVKQSGISETEWRQE
ncbi:MAG: type II toxin-antitoxin system HicA family toxin [bacterium]